jgi:hypothetical protein
MPCGHKTIESWGLQAAKGAVGTVILENAILNL